MHIQPTMKTRLLNKMTKQINFKKSTSWQSVDDDVNQNNNKCLQLIQKLKINRREEFKHEINQAISQQNKFNQKEVAFLKEYMRSYGYVDNDEVTTEIELKLSKFQEWSDLCFRELDMIANQENMDNNTKQAHVTCIYKIS